MGYPKDARIAWTCPGCGKSTYLYGSQLNAGKRRCTSTCPRTLERKVRSMKYDNVRDSQNHGQEWGMIVEGKVTQDPETKEYVLVDEDGVGFSSQEFLKRFAGKEVRFTCVAMEDAQRMEEMLKNLQAQGPS